MKNSNGPRQLLVISGTSKQCYQIAKDFTTSLDALWLSDSNIEGQITLAISKATTVLGRQYQAVVFDAHANKDKHIAFNANAFGAVVGTIIAGGYFVLLTPDLEKWTANSLFLQRLLRLLKQFSIPFYYNKKLPPPAVIKNFPLPPQHALTLTAEQQRVFDAMLRVVRGHRRRPLVLTSDRGRGKSTLLGKLAAYLLQQHIARIIISAPSRKIAETVFYAATIELKNTKNANKLLRGLHFLSPDALYQQKPKADLVLIDEAANIPLSLLEGFVKQHSRLIFATTEHGYEGSGRGFAIRFRSVLNTLCPQWNSARLEQPFRWCRNDPLERFSFQALLLNADIADISPTSKLVTKTKTVLSKCFIEQIEQQQLAGNEELLQQIFALLVSAHYQTRPSDLVHLLDNKQYQIFTMYYKNQLLAIALMVQEGGFNQELAEEIYNGKRRPQGHLIPQLLATHAAIKEAPCYKGDRIMRIAVHPELQGKGLGSYLLNYLMNYSQQYNQVDYIATSFGATPQLIAFWHRAGFTTLQIGMKRDASSGTHSIIMLYPLKAKAQSLLIKAQDNFRQSLPLLLADPLRHLEAPLVAALFRSSALLQNKVTQLQLNTIEKQLLTGFCDQQRGYESSLIAIYKLTLHCLYYSLQTINLSSNELKIIVAKVLQKQHWQTLVELTETTGKKQAITLLRQAVKKLVDQS